MRNNRFWERCRAAFSGATAKRWAAGLMVVSLAITGSSKSFATNERDVDYDWLMGSVSTLIQGFLPSFTVNLATADLDVNGMREDAVLAQLAAILRGNVGARTRVPTATFSNTEQEAIRADFLANRSVVDTDLEIEAGLECTILKGVAGNPPDCKLTSILKTTFALGPSTGGFVANLVLDLFTGYVTIGDNPATFTNINSQIIDPLVNAIIVLEPLAQNFETKIRGDLKLTTGGPTAASYGRWGESFGGPAGPTRRNAFGPTGNLDGDTNNNLAEYTAAGYPGSGNRETFLRSNEIGVYSAQTTDQPIRITATPGNLVVPAGTPFSLVGTFVGGSNSSPYTYLWEDAEEFGDDVLPNYGLVALTEGANGVTGVNTQTLTISDPTFAANDGFTPWIHISDAVTLHNPIPVGGGLISGSPELDALGGRTSVFWRIKVVETLPRGPIALCSGTQVLTASASALNDSNDGDTDNDPPTYQWRFHATDPAQLQFASTNIGGQTASTYTITASAPAEGYYACATTVWNGTPSGGAALTTVTNVVFFDFPVALPAAPSAPDLATASDSGSSTGDNITNDNTPTFTGTAEANALVTILNGGTPVGTATADLSGNWSITTSALTDGVKTITATANNCVGTGPASSSLGVTIDTGIPAAPTALDLISDTGANTTDNLTNNATPNITGSTGESGLTVRLFSSVTGLTVIASGTSAPGFSVNTTTLSSTAPSVTHSITATATDTAGNVSPASTALVVTVDTTAPSLPSTPDMTSATDSPPAANTDNITNDTTPDFQVTADAGTTIALISSVNGTVGSGGGPSATITSSALSSTAPSVTHNMTATSTDAAGNVSTSASALVCVIDVTAPVAPSSPDMTPGTDTGSSNTDNYTNNQQPVFTGTAEAGVTVSLFAPGVVGTGVATAGNWSIAPTAPLAGATYPTVRARATDIAGNTGAGAAFFSASVTPAVVIDITAPAAPTALDLTTDTGVSGTDDVTSVTTPTITGGRETGASVTLTSNVLGVVGTAPAAASTSFSITTSALTNAVHGLTATQTDLAGNTSLASTQLSVTVDNEAPTVSSETPTRSQSLATLANVQVTFSSPVFTPVAGTLTVGGSPATTISGSGAGPYTFSGYAVPADGTVNVAVLSAGVTDLAGNALTADAWTYNKTGSAPTVTLTTGTVVDGGSTNVSPIPFTATFSVGVTGFVDPGDVVLTGATRSAFAGGPSVYTFTVTPSGVGPVTVLIPAAAANAALTPFAASLASLQYGFNFDNVAPVVTADAKITNDTTPALTGTVDDTGATVTVTVGVQTFPASNLGDGTWRLLDNTLSALAEGVYNVQVSASDGAGNTGTTPGTGLLTIDLTAPTVAVDDTFTNDSTPALTGTVNETTAEVRVTVGAQSNLLATNNGNGTWTLPNNTLTALTDGTYEVSVTATDAAGNIGSDATTTELTIDTVAPVITLVGASSATVSCGDGFIDAGATAIDNIDGDISVNVIIAPVVGVQSPPGTYNVSYSVSDAAGNAGVAAVRVVTVSNDCPLAADVTPTLVDKQVGEDHTFELTYVGDIGTVSFQWQKADGAKTFLDIVGETGTELALTDLQVEDSGEYRCEVSDAVTTVYSPIIVLNVVNGVPALGLAGLGIMAVGSALAGAMVLRRKR